VYYLSTVGLLIDFRFTGNRF